MRAAPRVVRVDASDAARVAHLLEDYAEDEAAGAARRARAVDAALALVAKRLGPDDTARAKQFLDAGDLAACARLLLARYYDKLYDRHLGRRGARCSPSGPRTRPTPGPSPTPSSRPCRAPTPRTSRRRRPSKRRGRRPATATTTVRWCARRANRVCASVSASGDSATTASRFSWLLRAS